MSKLFNDIHNEGKNNGYTDKLFKQLITELKNFTGTNYNDLFTNTDSWNYSGKAWRNHIEHASRLWGNFDHNKAKNIIKKSMPEKYAEKVITFLPKGYKETQEMIAKIKDTSTALPTKPFRLKEDTPINWTSIFKQLGIEGEVKGYSSNRAKKYMRAGFFKGEWYDYPASRILGWKNVNINDLRKQVLMLKKELEKEAYYKFRVKEWFEKVSGIIPAGVDETKEKIELLKNTSTKLPAKPYKLREWIESRGQI